MDADDWIPGNAINIMVQHAEETNADVVEGGMTRVLGRHKFAKYFHTKTYKEITTPELFDDYFISFFGVNILSVNLCGKIFKKD